MKNCCDLPQDVLIDILSRSSVKSLLRFKCVCKSWYFLIESPCFMSKHLERTTLDEHRACLVVMEHDEYTKDDVFYVFANDNTLELEGPTKLRIHSRRQSFSQIMGPCNGVFCMYDYFEDLFLWNPATREIKDLQKPSIPSPPYSRSTSISFGFGFVPKTNDYYVIRLEQESQRDHIELYSLSTDSWRKINATLPAHIVYRRHSATYVNGVHYWWGKWKSIGGGCYCLISFERSDEVFQMTPVPKSLERLLPGVFTAWNESFAVMFSWHEDSIIEIWRPSEHGSEANWTKQLTIYPLPAGIGKPLGFWNSNREFIHLNKYRQLVSYNPQKKTVKVLIPGDRSGRTSWLTPTVKVSTYCESLVSFTGRS